MTLARAAFFSGSFVQIPVENDSPALERTNGRTQEMLVRDITDCQDGVPGQNQIFPRNLCNPRFNSSSPHAFPASFTTRKNGKNTKSVGFCRILLGSSAARREIPGGKSFHAKAMP